MAEFTPPLGPLAVYECEGATHLAFYGAEPKEDCVMAVLTGNEALAAEMVRRWNALPDLADALEGMLEKYTGGHDGVNGPENVAARAALAKAGRGN